jgi:hypothetical protein
MQLDPNEFKPKKHKQSDFFSWQLFRWLKTQPPAYYQVFSSPWGGTLGYVPDAPILYIGRMEEDGSFSGTELRRHCYHGQKINMFSYCMAEHRLDEWQDVTAQFWAEYREKGVCAIHGNNAHHFGDIGKDDTTRTCQHCGHVDHKTIEMVPKTIWRAA